MRAKRLATIVLCAVGATALSAMIGLAAFCASEVTRCIR